VNSRRTDSSYNFDMLKIAASILLSLFAATLPELFKQAKDEFSAGSYKQSLADFDLLDAESRKPGFEADRAKLAPVILFYRGANLAALGRKDEAKEAFIAYLSYMPNAAIASPPFPKATVDVFEAAQKETAGKNNTILAAYARFTPPAGWTLAADETWPQSPVRYLLTAEQKGQWATLKSAAERQAFVEAFWSAFDPTPGTPQNEFRAEFERRIAFADATYGTPKMTGSASERGAVFTFLGPPTYVGSAAVAQNADVIGALKSGGNSDINKAIHGSNSSSGLDKMSGTTPGDDKEPQRWRTMRESWYYRTNRLPSSVTAKEVRFDFVTEEGYGTAIMQKDAVPMQTLGQAVEAARRDKKLN
jgi:GWxTD domain-containing protein